MDTRLIIDYGNNKTDNTNGANIVVDYSEGLKNCYFNKNDATDITTYSYYLMPVCSLQSEE